jgi:hypothetical protein
MNKNELYEQQLHFIFSRPVSLPAWYWTSRPDEEDVFGEDPFTAFEFIEKLCQQPWSDLAPYSDDQVALGLEFIFNNSCSNLACDFKSAEVPFQRREQALRDIFVLFRDVFNPRCAVRASAGAQGPSPKINAICYMFWDVCPLSTFFGAVDHQSTACYKAIASVMERCLSLDNPACVESGLHGLGHMAFFLPDIAVPIIDRYLKRKNNENTALVQYAKAARTGMIQ